MRLRTHHAACQRDRSHHGEDPTPNRLRVRVMRARCENIVAGVARPSSTYRAANAWEVPATQPDDVAFALKCINVEQRRDADTRRIVDVLVGIGREGNWL